MSAYQLHLYDPDVPSAFVRDVVVEMTAEDAREANAVASAHRIPLRWWPSDEASVVEVESPRLRVIHQLSARIVKVVLFCDSEEDFHHALDQLGYVDDRYDGLFLRRVVLVDLDEFIAELTLVPPKR